VVIDEQWTHDPRHGWQDQALCREVDPELYFPGKGAKDQARKARAVCGWCRVCAECRAYALEDVTLTEGIFGGMTPTERRRARRKEQS